MALRALATVNVAAIERNTRLLRERLTGGARLCAVVKADGYGHGAVAAARGALAGGAKMLAVAAAVEAAALREARIEAPVLVMGAVSEDELQVALAARAELVAWSETFTAAVAAAAGRRGTREAVPMHVKLDTGMGRLGSRDAVTARAVADRIAATSQLTLAGAMTHFATADADLDYTREQLAAFVAFLDALRHDHPGVTAHAANSAATLRLPAAHLDMVRCGIAVYGLDPMNEDACAHGLEAALELTSYVAAIKPIRAGQSCGYGRTHIARRDGMIGTVPIGYADGVRRVLSNRGEVLAGGRRRMILGTVSMDNIMIDLGSDGEGVAVGDQVVLIGRDGEARQSAEALAAQMGTINYEVTCGISARVPRSHHRDGELA